MTNSVRAEFAWGVIEWMAGAGVGNSQELSIARMWLPSGNETDAHAHDNCEESVYVLSGELECVTDGASVRITRGEHTMVPRGAVHRLRSVGADQAEVLLSYSSADRAFRVAPST
ncbi:MAG: mannose-6-phosphate isomerase-like protein (cupin superfamily) [Verrucomicrobiales bacterium]|jgi:mannose-6-phosphate isomerase-like protein (cupin superfamily)